MAVTLVFSILSLLIYNGYCQVEVDFKFSKNCYNIGDNLTASAVYTGSGTPTGVEWYYNNQSSANIYLRFSSCSLFGGVTDGYPDENRFKFQCHSESNYTMTLKSLTDDELTGNFVWGATFQISGTLTKPETDKEKLTKCDETTTPGTITTEEPFPWWYILIGIGGLYLCGIVIGIFMYCCKDEPWNKIYVEDKTYWWIFLLIIVIVGSGILTVYLICKGCGRFNGIIFNVENPAVFTAGERIEVICSLKKRVPEAVMHWHGKNEVEITATHGHPSVSIPELGKKLLDLGVATEDKAGKYKSTATMTDNPQRVIYEKTLDIKIKDDSTQNEMPMKTKKKNQY